MVLGTVWAALPLMYSPIVMGALHANDFRRAVWASGSIVSRTRLGLRCRIAGVIKCALSLNLVISRSGSNAIGIVNLLFSGELPRCHLQCNGRKSSWRSRNRNEGVQ